MSIRIQKYIKVAYPRSDSLRQYIRLKNFGARLFRFIRIQHLRNFIERIIAVAEPSGKVVVVAEPNEQSDELQARSVTIMSANLWHDWPRNRRIKERLNCLVEVIKSEGVDILLLQEIFRTNEFEADKWLSDELGMAYIYSRSNGHAPGIGFEEGLAIYSRFPIKDHRLAQLSHQNNPFSRRMALGTRIDAQGADFLAFSVHLGLLSSENKKQISWLKDWVEEESGSIPAVIGGDFNAHENTSQIRSTKTLWHDSYRAIHPDGEGYSHEIRWPWGKALRRSRLDYLFLRRGNHTWKVDDAQHIDQLDCSLSDHKPVLIKASLLGTRLSSSFSTG